MGRQAGGQAEWAGTRWAGEQTEVGTHQSPVCPCAWAAWQVPARGIVFRARRAGFLAAATQRRVCVATLMHAMPIRGLFVTKTDARIAPFAALVEGVSQASLTCATVC